MELSLVYVLMSYGFKNIHITLKYIKIDIQPASAYMTIKAMVHNIIIAHNKI